MDATHKSLVVKFCDFEALYVVQVPRTCENVVAEVTGRLHDNGHQLSVTESSTIWLQPAQPFSKAERWMLDWIQVDLYFCRCIGDKCLRSAENHCHTKIHVPASPQTHLAAAAAAPTIDLLATDDDGAGAPPAKRARADIEVSEAGT
jgi:hypothetical protein